MGDYNESLSNIEMERASLTSLLTYPEELQRFTVAPDDMHDRRHRILLTAMVEMNASGQAIDVETLTHHLNSRKQLDLAGGFAYIAEIAAFAFSTLHPLDYVPTLIDLSVRRKAIREAQELARKALDKSVPVNETINEYSTRLPQLVKVQGGAEHISVFASRHYDRLAYDDEHPEEAAARMLRTSYIDFDDITYGGLRTGELMMVYGKPGLGKTKWVHQMGAQLAKNGYPGVIFQMETSEDEIMDREFSRETKIPTERLETANLMEEEWPVYTHAVETMSDPDLPLYLNFKSDWSTVTLRSELTRLKLEVGIRWFVLDYLRFLTDRYGKDETERLNYISIQLKRLCNQADLAGVVIHSMNKAGISAGSPELEHGSGGADIQYDCDKAIFMIEHQPEGGDAPRYPNYRTFVFRKSRRRIKRPVFHMIAQKDYPEFVAPTPESTPQIAEAQKPKRTKQPASVPEPDWSNEDMEL
jgi:replicative DNA helicase